jgi:hypothetical protein
VNKGSVLLAFACILFSTVNAQVPDIDSALTRCPFIRTELNVVHNDTLALHSFYTKMAELKAGTN